MYNIYGILEWFLYIIAYVLYKFEKILILKLGCEYIQNNYCYNTSMKYFSYIKLEGSSSENKVFEKFINTKKIFRLEKFKEK